MKWLLKGVDFHLFLRFCDWIWELLQQYVFGFFFTSLFVFPDTSQAVFHVSMHINYHVSFPLDNHNTPEYKWLWNETLHCVSISEIFKEAAN